MNIFLHLSFAQNILRTIIPIRWRLRQKWYWLHKCFVILVVISMLSLYIYNLVMSFKRPINSFPCDLYPKKTRRRVQTLVSRVAKCLSALQECVRTGFFYFDRLWRHIFEGKLLLCCPPVDKVWITLNKPHVRRMGVYWNIELTWNLEVCLNKGREQK